MQPVKVPDFRGLNRQQANDLAGSLGLYIQVVGNTQLLPTVKVSMQDIPPGTEVSAGTILSLTFTDTATTD
jgi:beta-lactam-binding protein with PASTA domain